MNLELVSLPFIGAFIGYFTNYVAIKMLFLPKKAYFVFGFRVPFTPGLIPKKRKELVEKISDVVSNKVINKKDIIKYIYKRKNRKFLYEFSKKVVGSLLSKKISDISLNYEKIEKQIELFLDKNLEKIVKDNLKDIKIDVEYIVYNAFLLLDKNKKTKDYISKDKLSKIKELLNSLSYEALERLAESMDSKDIKQLIKGKIKEAMDRYADESNILTASFITMASPLIEDNEKVVDVIVKEIGSILTDDVTKRKVAESIYISFEREFLDSTPEYTIKKTGFGSFDDIAKTLGSKVSELFDRLSVKDKIIDSAVGGLKSAVLAKQLTKLMKDIADRYTFNDMIGTIRPDIVKKLPSMAVNNLLYVIRKESEMIFNFDIAKIAKEKLDKLDISDIEDVVLNISKDQFKYINIFGGILGFLIGLAEVLISLTHLH